MNLRLTRCAVAVETALRAARSSGSPADPGAPPSFFGVSPPAC